MDLAKDVKEALKDSLRALGDEFKANRLAYLLLSSKDERLLCGALARGLHETFAHDPTLHVRRNWPTGLGRKDVDIAVLQHQRPVALVEAKAAISSDLLRKGKRPFPIGAVQDDVDKLRAIEFDSDRYALLFVIRNQQALRDEHDPALPYAVNMKRVVETAEIDEGFERFRVAVGGLPVLGQGEVLAGNAFGVDVSVLYWLLAV